MWFVSFCPSRWTLNIVLLYRVITVFSCDYLNWKIPNGANSISVSMMTIEVPPRFWWKVRRTLSRCLRIRILMESVITTQSVRGDSINTWRRPLATWHTVTRAIYNHAHTAHCACVERADTRRLVRRVTIVMLVTIEERLRPTWGMRGYTGPELCVALPIVIIGSWHRRELHQDRNIRPGPGQLTVVTWKYHQYPQSVHFTKYQILTKNAEDDCVCSDPELQAGWLSLVSVVIKWGEILQSSAVTELVLVLQHRDT